MEKATTDFDLIEFLESVELHFPLHGLPPSADGRATKDGEAAADERFGAKDFVPRWWPGKALDE